MTIKKFSSQEFNDMFEQTKNKVKDINNNFENTKKEIKQKLLTMQYETEYLNYCFNDIVYKEHETKNYVLLENNPGLYESYCNIIHPSLKKDLINIFNLQAINDEELYFRDEVVVKINDIQNQAYKNILKADNNKTKEIFFKELDYKSETKKTNNEDFYYIDSKNPITIEIAVNNNKFLGLSKFNMIEIDPFLYRSFHINMIEIYDDNNNVVLKTPEMKRVGKTRIILDKKYIFKKVKIHIAPQYKTKNIDGKEIIPFGLKHIYFYEADFRNDSYIIVPYKSENFIDNIENRIMFYTPFGQHLTTLTENNIQVFLEYNNGVLENEQQPSQNIKKPFSKNTKELYLKIPLSIKDNFKTSLSSLIACKIYISNR